MRVLAIIKRIVRQMLRDRRTLALLFLAPLLILTLLNLVFNGETVEPVLGVKNVAQSEIEQFEKAEIQVKSFRNVKNVEETILQYHLDGFLMNEHGSATLTLLNDDPLLAKNLRMKMEQIFQAEQQSEFLKQNQIQIEPIPQKSIEITYIHGDEETSIVDVFSPILVGFFVFLIAGIGLLKERVSGTLERLMATPIKRWEIVTAYLIGFGMFAVLQTIIVILFAVYVLDIVIVGSIWNVIIINLCLAFVALSLGILLSSFAATEFQMFQFIPIVIVPQVFFSGIFPLEGMADWLQMIARLMPLYYGAEALVGVMYRGESFVEMVHHLYPLLAFAVAFILLNLIALKRYRKI